MVNRKSLSEIKREAITLLCQEFGVADTLRFIGQNGQDNYTEERRELYKDLTLETILEEARTLEADG